MVSRVPDALAQMRDEWTRVSVPFVVELPSGFGAKKSLAIHRHFRDNSGAKGVVVNGRH